MKLVLKAQGKTLQKFTESLYLNSLDLIKEHFWAIISIVKELVPASRGGLKSKAQMVYKVYKMLSHPTLRDLLIEYLETSSIITHTVWGTSQFGITGHCNYTITTPVGSSYLVWYSTKEQGQEMIVTFEIDKEQVKQFLRDFDWEAFMEKCTSVSESSGIKEVHDKIMIFVGEALDIEDSDSDSDFLE